MKKAFENTTFILQLEGNKELIQITYRPGDDNRRASESDWNCAELVHRMPVGRRVIVSTMRAGVAPREATIRAWDHYTWDYSKPMGQRMSDRESTTGWDYFKKEADKGKRFSSL